jgi:hypothetical protein
MNAGGKRIGAGAKKGQKKAIKDGSLVRHAPRMIQLAEQWLNGEDKEDQKWAFKELMPYVFSKQREKTEVFFPEGLKVQVVYEDKSKG